MTTISVNGEGRAAVQPEVAHLLLGVRTTAPSARDALSAAAEQANALVATLHSHGVDSRDLLTRGVSVHPRYSNDGTRVAEYEASSELMVTVRDVDAVGPLIDAAASAVGDAITVGGVTFSVADPGPAMTVARAAAIADARFRADDYARAAGLEVGGIVSISEPSPSGGPTFRALPFSAGLPIESGALELTAVVTVVFEM